MPVSVVHQHLLHAGESGVFPSVQPHQHTPPAQLRRQDEKEWKEREETAGGRLNRCSATEEIKDHQESAMCHTMKRNIPLRQSMFHSVVRVQTLNYVCRAGNRLSDNYVISERRWSRRAQKAVKDLAENASDVTMSGWSAGFWVNVLWYSETLLWHRWPTGGASILSCCICLRLQVRVQVFAVRLSDK